MIARGSGQRQGSRSSNSPRARRPSPSPPTVPARGPPPPADRAAWRAPMSGKAMTPAATAAPRDQRRRWARPIASKARGQSGASGPKTVRQDENRGDDRRQSTSGRCTQPVHDRLARKTAQRANAIGGQASPGGPKKKRFKRPRPADPPAAPGREPPHSSGLGRGRTTAVSRHRQGPKGGGPWARKDRAGLPALQQAPGSAPRASGVARGDGGGAG